MQPGADYGADYVLYDRHPSEAHSSYCVLALTGSKRPECIRWTDIEAVSRVCSQVQRCEGACVLHTCVLCLLHGKRPAGAVCIDSTVKRTCYLAETFGIQACACVQVLKKLVLLYVFEEPGIAMGSPDCLAALTVSLCSLIKSHSCTLPHQYCLWHILRHRAGSQPDAHTGRLCR